MINVILADDQSVIRQALSEMLENRGNYNVLGQAENGEVLLSLLKQHKPDIIIMDVTMPKLNGVETLKKMAEEMEEVPPVLFFSSDDREKSVRAALRAGAKGYVPKHADLEEFVFAIGSILAGKTYVSPSITAPLISGNYQQPQSEAALSILTTRELEIFMLLADGKKNREIAEILHISIRTVDTHRSNILKKLHARNNADLVKLAIAHGLISV